MRYNHCSNGKANEFNPSVSNLPCIVQRRSVMSSIYHSLTRFLINIAASMDLKTVPPNLRPFVTPNVRRLFIDTIPSEGTAEIEASTASDVLLSRPCPSRPLRDSGPLSSQGLLDSSPAPSSNNKASEIVRLRAENLALRNHCEMWRKRAEMHGEANLQLLKFARAMRDQASQIARDRNELEKRCFLLKKTLDGNTSYSDELGVHFCRHRPSIANTRSFQDDEMPTSFFHGFSFPSLCQGLDGNGQLLFPSFTFTSFTSICLPALETPKFKNCRIP